MTRQAGERTGPCNAGYLWAMAGGDTERAKSRRETAGRRANLVPIGLIVGWIGTTALVWKVTAAALCLLGGGFLLQSMVLGVHERRAAGLPTDPWAIITASVWVPGVVLILLAVVVVLLARGF
jgi:hypothetical protein